MPAGTVITIGVAGILVHVTSKSPAVFAAALKSMVYSFGLLVALEYVRFAVVVPVHIAGLAPKVIVGGAVAFKVTVIGVRVLKQPVVLFVSVTFPL